MPTLLLDSVIGGGGKPYSRNFWNHTEGTKKIAQVKFLNSPYIYNDAGTALGRANGGSLMPAYGAYAAGVDCVVKCPANTFATENATTVANNQMLYTSTDYYTYNPITLPAGNYRPTGIVFFNNKWWIFTASRTLISTDATATSFVQSTSVAPVTLYKPIVFNNRMVMAPFGSIGNLRSTLDAETYTTHTLPQALPVLGMATDGTTLIIILANTSAACYVYKTTDLTTWTAVEVRYTATGSNIISNSGISPTNVPFYPIDIHYTGSQFILAGTDVMTQALNAGSIDMVKFYTAANGSSPFVFTGTFRLPTDEATNFGSTGSGMTPHALRHFLASQNRSMSSMATQNNRTYMCLAGDAAGVVDTTIYKMNYAFHIYTQDGGATWDMIDRPPSPFYTTGSSTALIPSCTYAIPTGIVSFHGHADQGSSTVHLRPNPLCKELVLGVR